MSTEYEDKIKELQVFLPVLERKINDARSRKDNSASSRLEKLRDIVNKRIKVPIGILIKTEETIKKFLKDAPNIRKPVTANKSPENFQQNVNIKTEVKVETESGNNVDPDDDDDVQIVPTQPASDCVIVLDDDSSDEEHNAGDKKPSQSSLAEMGLAKEIKTEESGQTEEFSCGPIKNMDLNDDSKCQQINSDHSTDVTTLNLDPPSKLPSETNKLDDSVENESRSLGISSSQETDEFSTPSKNDDEFSGSSKIPTLTFTPGKDGDKGHSELPKISPPTFDPDKVAESRSILLELESQLKHLTTAQLPLLIEDTKEVDSIDTFLNRSNESPSIEPKNDSSLLGTPLKDQDREIEVSEKATDKPRSSPELVLPFPFPKFNQDSLAMRRDIVDMLNSSSPSSEKQIPEGDTTMESTDKAGEPGPSSVQANNVTPNLQISGDSDKPSTALEIVQQPNESVSSEPVNSILLRDTPANETPNSAPNSSSHEALETSDITASANNRLAEIIASLRKNLSDGTEKGKNESEVPKDIPELFVNKMQLTEIPSVVQDMLSATVASEDDDDDMLVMDLSDKMANLSQKLLSDLGDSKIGDSDDFVPDQMGSDDSLDREIEEAMAEANKKATDLDNGEVVELIVVTDHEKEGSSERAPSAEIVRVHVPVETVSVDESSKNVSSDRISQTETKNIHSTSPSASTRQEEVPESSSTKKTNDDISEENDASVEKLGLQSVSPKRLAGESNEVVPTVPDSISSVDLETKGVKTVENSKSAVQKELVEKPNNLTSPEASPERVGDSTSQTTHEAEPLDSVGSSANLIETANEIQANTPSLEAKQSAESDSKITDKAADSTEDFVPEVSAVLSKGDDQNPSQNSEVDLGGLEKQSEILQIEIQKKEAKELESSLEPGTSTTSEIKSELDELVEQREELQWMLNEIKEEERTLSKKSSASKDNITAACATLSDISTDNDVVSLGLSEISDPESGEICDKPPMPNPKPMPPEVKEEFNANADDQYSPHKKSIKITIPNDYDASDLRTQLSKKRKKKRKKRNRKDNSSHSPIRYIDSQGNIIEPRNDSSSDSDTDAVINPAHLRYVREKPRHGISGLLDDDIKKEYFEMFSSCEEGSGRHRYILRKTKVERLSWDEDTRLSLNDDNIYQRNSSPPSSLVSSRVSALHPKRRTSESPNELSKSPSRRGTITYERSRSSRRLSKSPERNARSPRRELNRRSSRSPRRSSRSPRRLLDRQAKSPVRSDRSPRRSSRSPKRLGRSISRRSVSPIPRTRSPRRSDRSPIRRLSRSPRRRQSRSPRRRQSRSPRRRGSRSPRRRRSRSPKRRQSRSPRRELSRSPRRRLSRSPPLSRPPRRQHSRSPRRSSRSPRRSPRTTRSSRSPTRQNIKTLMRKRSRSRSPKQRSESLRRSRSPPQSLKCSDKSPSRLTARTLDKDDCTKNDDKIESYHSEKFQVSGSSKDNAAIPTTTIDISDSEEEDDTKNEDRNDSKNGRDDAVGLTIEVSDDEDFLEAPPPPIISIKETLSPKHETEDPSTGQNEEEEEANIILVDDDVDIGAPAKIENEAKLEPADETSSSDIFRGDVESNELLNAEVPNNNVETLKEKNLRELQAIQVKLEKEIGISKDFLSQLIGNALNKFNDDASPANTNIPLENEAEFPQESAQQPSLLSLPPQQLQYTNVVVARPSIKDPRLNRVRPAAPAPTEPPPPPPIPRLTPAVAIPTVSGLSKKLPSCDEYSDDEDDVSIESGTISDESHDSDHPKSKKQYVKVELAKLEEIIGNQIQKFLALNKQSYEANKSAPKKDAPTAAKASSKPKPRRNALSKDGSGPPHMSAEKIVSDIRKSVQSLYNPKTSTPEKTSKSKPKPRPRSRIRSRIRCSSGSDRENTPTESPTKSPMKSPTADPDSLRSRITNDVAGIIKLGKAPKSAKLKPTPALKLAEQVSDVNLLTPLRELPYDDKRKKNADHAQTKKQKRVPKNTNISIHCNSGEKNCLLCKDMEKDEDLISHYVNVHRENEVYLARLEVDQLKALLANPNYVKPAKKLNVEKFTGKCPFCDDEMTCPIGRYMEHFASHTGEYAYECDCCGTRDSRKRDLLSHCNTQCEKGAKFIYVYRYDLSNKEIDAYVCSHCNYIQLNKANVIKHIRTEHDQQLVKENECLSVTLFKVGESTSEGSEQNIDNIEVNNEAIDEENAEDDDFDSFENAPVSPMSDSERRAVANEAVEYVKNELLMDVIDDIDWKSIEDSLVESAPLEGEIPTPYEEIRSDTPPVPPTPSIDIQVAKNELPESEDIESDKTQKDLGAEIFTEIHALSLQGPTESSLDYSKKKPTSSRSDNIVGEVSVPDITVPNRDQAISEQKPKLTSLEINPSLDLPTVPSAKTSRGSKPSKDNKNQEKGHTQLKDIATSNPKMSRVQCLGFEEIAPKQLRYYCLVSNCATTSLASLEEIRKHFKAHTHKWSGKCEACGGKALTKHSASLDRELMHFINEHLPKRSLVAKILRPWIADDSLKSKKSKDVCEMLTKSFHLENLYKCMANDCIFTTNSSKDMQFHIPSSHSDDLTALNCCYCTESFVGSNGLVNHIGRVHGASRYQCPYCFYRSCAAYNVQMHQRTFHADKKNAKILVCSGQTHTFSTEMLEILDNRQKNVKALKCPFFSGCRKWIYVKHLLMDHVKRDHSQKEPVDIHSELYDCIYCSYATTDLLSIRQHMSNEHPNRLLYVCGLVFIKALHPLAQDTVDITSVKTTSLVYIGGKVNKSKFESKDLATFLPDTIEAVNSGADPVLLNTRIRQMFGEAAIDYNDVEAYMKKIAEGMEPDIIKTEVTSELDQLVGAVLNPTGLVGKRLYKCGFPKCQGTFENFSQFDTHINVHRGNKKEPIYRCPHCNVIVAMNQIRIHTTLHQRHRYLCFFCGESNASQITAIEHLKSMHSSQSNVFVYLTKDKEWNRVFSDQESRIFVAMPRNNNADVVEAMVNVLRKKLDATDSLETADDMKNERPESPIDQKEVTTIPVFVSLDSRLSCNIDSCPFVAKTDDDLEQHISERHLIIMSGMYSCAHCPYTLCSAQLKISRIRKHLQYHGPTIVVCNVCNYYHYKRSSVLDHISACHPYNFVTSTLHTRSTNGTKTKIEILYSKNVRSPEDSYKCTLCEAVLTECDDFFIHMKELHQLNVRFKCDMCPFFDNTLQAVETHGKKAHSEEAKIRIRSVFLPAGGKWVQNLSPFELLIESSDPPPEVSPDVPVEPPMSTASTADQNSTASTANKSERKTPEESSAEPTETSGQQESDRKRKLDEGSDSKPKPNLKRIRIKCVKRRNMSKPGEDDSKRKKTAISPEPTEDKCTKSAEPGPAENSTTVEEAPVTPKEEHMPRLKLVPVEKLLRQDVANDMQNTNQLVQLPPLVPVSVPVPPPTCGNYQRTPADVFLFCMYCGWKSDCFAKLRTHVRAEHLDSSVHYRITKKLLCAYCNTTASFAELKIHHSSTHPNDVFITREANNHKKCAECMFEYSDIKDLKRHCELEHAMLPMQMHSSFEYLDQEFLEELLKVGNGQLAEVERCSGCDHIYLDEVSCKTHIGMAHALLPNMAPVRCAFKKLLYGCNQCKVFFETELRAIQHIRKHVDPYGCRHCEMNFATHNALVAHYNLFHKIEENAYRLNKNVENERRFMEMLLRFSNGLVLSKLEAGYTNYGQHDLFNQRIDSMEKIELQNWISRQERSNRIETVARIKLELESEANSFYQSQMDPNQSN